MSQRAQLPAPDRVDAVGPTLDLAQRLASGLQERRAGLGQLDVTAGAEKQRRADGLLQHPDLLAQERLGDAEPGGRAAEVELVGEDGEVAEGGEAQPVGDIHINMIHRNSVLDKNGCAHAMLLGPCPPRTRPRHRSARIGPGQPRIAIAMLVGVALGFCFPDGAPRGGFRATDLQVLSTPVPPDDQVADRPAAVRHAGRRDRRPRRRHEADRAGSPFRSLLYFEVVTTLALVVGLLAVNLVQPGVGVNLGAGAGSRRRAELAPDAGRRSPACSSTACRRASSRRPPSNEVAADRGLHHHLRGRAVAGAAARRRTSCCRSARA